MVTEEPGKETPENSPQRQPDGKFAKGNTFGKEYEFKKGHVPTSPGRPKRRHLTDALMKHMDKKASAFDFTKKVAKKLGLDPDEVTNYEVLMLTAMGHGMKGKADILKQLWDRTEGAVPKHMSLSSDDPVQVYINDFRNATEVKPPEEGQEEEGNTEEGRTDEVVD